MKWNHDIPSYTVPCSTILLNSLRNCMELGLRWFGIFSAPPVGCVPSQRTLLGGFLRECARTPTKHPSCKILNSRRTLVILTKIFQMPTSYTMMSTTHFSISSKILINMVKTLFFSTLYNLGLFSRILHYLNF